MNNLNDVGFSNDKIKDLIEAMDREKELNELNRQTCNAISYKADNVRGFYISDDDKLIEKANNLIKRFVNGNISNLQLFSVK